jgi:hypothetical protein
LPSSDSRWAMTDPADPEPMMIKSNSCMFPS